MSESTVPTGFTSPPTFEQLDVAVAAIGEGAFVADRIAAGQPCCEEFGKYGVHSHAINQTEANTAKDSNPKDGIGETKLPLYLVPATAIAMYSLAHLNGGLKYGFWNWRKAGVRLSVYVNALRRHLSAYENGEEVDPDDGVPHLSAMGACLNIIIDAGACGKLVDDRPPRAPIRAFFNRLTPIVTALKKLHAKRDPRHWRISDSDICSCGRKLDEPGHGEVGCTSNIFALIDPNAPRSK
jgi:dATP/dGTP diphosphohydrolase